MKINHFTYAKLLVMVSFTVWFTLLTVRITINSATFLKRMGDGSGSLQDFLIIILAYTPTNVALLSVFADRLTAGLSGRIRPIPVGQLD